MRIRLFIILNKLIYLNSNKRFSVLFMLSSLFCYGTLQEKSVFETVSGICAQSQSASLQGFRRFRVARADYPAIVACSEIEGEIEGDSNGGSSVQGLVWHSVDLSALRRLDKFEGPFYQRKIVTIATAEQARRKAWTYVLAPTRYNLITDEPWDLTEYRTAFLKRFARSAKRF